MLLGVDVGTGGTRAVLIDRAGTVLASFASEHAPIRSEHIGWAEQEPEDWWRAAREAIAGAMAATELTGAEIEAVGLTGQMHGCVMLDAEGKVLRPALIWADQRTQPQCDWLTEKIGFERLIELTCNPALPNFTLTKLLWVKEHQPEIFAKIAHVLCPKDYVRYRLTSEFAMDMQEASGTLLLDVTNRRWSAEMAEAAGIPMEWLPRLVRGAGDLSPGKCGWGGATGLAAGTPVAAGAGDQGAGAVGMGILAPGSVSATIGTSGVVFAATDAPIKDRLGRLHTFCHAAPGRWHVMGVTNGAGLSLRYFRDTFSPGSSYEELSLLAGQAPAGSDGLMWAPYLFGERTPHLDPEARAAFVGITASHTQGHFIRAVLEGVAFSLKDTFTLLLELGVPVKAIRLGGGGSSGDALAADSGGCVWASGGVAGGGGRWSVWCGTAGGDGDWGVGKCRGGLCGHGAGGGDDCSEGCWRDGCGL